MLFVLTRCLRKIFTLSLRIRPPFLNSLVNISLSESIILLPPFYVGNLALGSSLHRRKSLLTFHHPRHPRGSISSRHPIGNWWSSPVAVSKAFCKQREMKNPFDCSQTRKETFRGLKSTMPQYIIH